MLAVASIVARSLPVKLTDMTLQKLPIPEKGQKLHSDDSLPGFAVRVS